MLSMIKKFITQINGQYGPILEDTTWVKACWQAYDIHEDLKIVGFLTDPIMFIEIADNRSDIVIKPTENIIYDN